MQYHRCFKTHTLSLHDVEHVIIKLIGEAKIREYSIAFKCGSEVEKMLLMEAEPTVKNIIAELEVAGNTYGFQVAKEPKIDIL